MNNILNRTIRTLTAAAAIAVSTVAAGSGTAAAQTTSASGATATTVLSCAYDGAIIDYINNGFDYVKLWGYDSEIGWAAGTWQPANRSIGTVSLQVSSGATYAVYAQFADWTGTSWSFGGEWVGNSSRTNYWCRT